MKRLLTGAFESIPFLMVAGVVGYAAWLVVAPLLEGNLRALWAAPFAALVLLVGVSHAVEWWEER